jgi:hypothetical protein
VNLYAYAGNNPIAYGDPFGLCASDDPPDEISVSVCVRRGNKVTEEDVTATRVTDASLLRKIAEGATKLQGGSSDYSPGEVSAEIMATVAAGAVYVYGQKTADGGEVLSLAVTKGQNLTFRSDVSSQLGMGSSFLHRPIGGKYQPACQVLGHEGVHLVQHRAGSTNSSINEQIAEPITWKCR